MTLPELTAYWTQRERENAPLRNLDGPSTPRDRLVRLARQRLAILDPRPRVWERVCEPTTLGLLVVRHRRRALDRTVDWSLI